MRLLHTVYLLTQYKVLLPLTESCTIFNRTDFSSPVKMWWMTPLKPICIYLLVSRWISKSPPLIHFPCIHHISSFFLLLVHLLTEWNMLRIKALIKPNALNAPLFTLPELDSSHEEADRETQDGRRGLNCSIQHFFSWIQHLLLSHKRAGRLFLYCVVDTVSLFLWWEDSRCAF